MDNKINQSIKTLHVFCALASESTPDAESVSEQLLHPEGETKTTDSDVESSDSSDSEEEEKKKKEEEETKPEQEVSGEHHTHTTVY